MKCSMMFKCCLAFCVVVVVVLLAGQVSADTGEFLPDGTGTLLLVHGENLTENQALQVERLVTMAAALGKTVDYGTAEQCKNVLAQYNYVILYEAADMNRSFGTALKKSGAELMVIGSATLRRYLTLVGKGRMLGESEVQENGKLTYAFSTGEEYECIAHWEGLFQIPAGEYQSGSIQAGDKIYPFCTDVADAWFIPVTDLSQTLVRAAVIQEIAQWMWPYADNPAEYAQFLVLDSVYPFMPASQLLEIVEQAEELSVPYVISVMPLTDNYDYPAMTQFCQVLAYAQSQSAGIILHAPIIHKTLENEEDEAELLEKLTDMTMAYFNNGVYPLGIEVPYSWLNQELYLDVLGRYRTVFVHDDENPVYFDLNAHTSQISRQGHQLVYPKIDLDEKGVSQLQCYSSATYVDCSSASDLFLHYAEQGRNSENPFMDLREYNHTVWVNNNNLTYQNRTVYVNGERKDTSFTPSEYDANYDFRRSALERMSIDLQGQNHVLLAVVVAILVIFLAGIAYARRLMRRRFFLKADSGRDEE